MAKVKNRHRLKRKQVLILLGELHQALGEDFFDEDATVDVGFLEGREVVFVDGEINYIIDPQEGPYYTLDGVYRFKPQSHGVTVDMGAVKFVTNGADIMAPGIIDADPAIKENDIVWICDEKNKRALAIGKALMDGPEMVSGSKGKAIRNIHHVGDHLWELLKGLE